MYIKLNLIFLFFLSTYLVVGQSNIGIELGGRIGVLVPHRPVMKHLPSEHILGLDFSIFKNVSGEKKWHKVYNTPNIGITFYNSNLGNKKVLGNITGLTSWIDFPFINEIHHRFGLNLRLGLAYVSKTFDLISNPTNIPISSHLNCLAIGGLQYQYIWNKFSIGSRLELTHLSNAAFEAPNLGLNMYQASFTFGYKFSKNKMHIELLKNPSRNSDTLITSRNYLYFIGFIGRKQIFSHLGESFNIRGGSVAFQHVFALPVGLEVGFDLMQNDSDLKLLADEQLIVDKVIKTGVYLGYILTLDKLHFVVAMGHYLHDDFNLNGKLYHRVGMRYTFLNRFVVSSTLKSHWGNADYLEVGLGMRFG